MTEIIEQETPAYTIIDLVAADEQEAYSMIDETGTEQCPDCKTMPNNPRRSIDGLRGIVTGTGFMFEIETITRSEAKELMKTANWAGNEQEI